MTPIGKNIIVVDEQGNTYEATYPKRAKGLVKNGRARFVDENKICLACPPDIDSEDKSMDHFSDMQDMDTREELSRAAYETQGAQAKSPVLSMAYVLTRIDQILNDTAHVHEAIAAIRDMPVNEGMNNMAGDTARGEAISHAVQSRETTNQQLIRLLEKMYDDLKPKTPSDDVLKFEKLADVLSKYHSEEAANILAKAAQQLFVKPGAPAVMNF